MTNAEWRINGEWAHLDTAPVYFGRDGALRRPRRVERRHWRLDSLGEVVPPAGRGRGHRGAMSLPSGAVSRCARRTPSPLPSPVGGRGNRQTARGGIGAFSPAPNLNHNPNLGEGTIRIRIRRGN